MPRRVPTKLGRLCGNVSALSRFSPASGYVKLLGHASIHSMPQSKPPFPFHATDAGRKESRRPHSKNDCIVRALAVACDVSFDRAYDALAASGRRHYRPFDFRTWAKSAAPFVRLGARLTWHLFPFLYGEPRMNPAMFCEQFKTGRWILRTVDHLFAVVDGVVFDEHCLTSRRLCIYGAWSCTGGFQGRERVKI